MIDKEIDSIFYHVICRQELSSVIVCYYLTFTEPSKLLVLIQARIFRLYLFYFFLSLFRAWERLIHRKRWRCPAGRREESSRMRYPKRRCRHNSQDISSFFCFSFIFLSCWFFCRPSEVKTAGTIISPLGRQTGILEGHKTVPLNGRNDERRASSAMIRSSNKN